jgi:hypothetical protein
MTTEATVETPAAAPAAEVASATAVPVTPAPAASLAAPESTPAAPAAVSRPEGLDESFWDPEANSPKWTDVTARLARAAELEAAETARTADVPAKVEDYKLDIVGEPVLGLDSKPVAIDPKDPMAQAILEVAVAQKIPQGQMSALARAYAQAQVNGAKALQESVNAETAKLGDKAGERVQAVVNYIKQVAGDDADSAIKALWSAGAVVAWEKAMAAAGQQPITALQGQSAPKKSIAETWFPTMKTKAA